MSTQVMVCRFAQDADAFQVMSEVKNVAGVQSAAVVTRDENGTIHVPEYASAGGDSSGFWTGSLVGALVGVLGGPLGVLLGWSAGALLGSSFDASDAVSEAADDTDGIAVLAQGIAPGTHVLIVDADPSAVSTVDSLVAAKDGSTAVFPSEEVEAEVANARKAADEAAKAARKERREERREEFSTKVKDLFHRK
ncbi:hypothetical protein [Nocardioides sp. GXZ039]|uniref:hypothetical protein n=1 Tax=Nocardioides sp. GXZ039 TaxID=3136018 RepID=UPI0030F46157